MHILIGVALLYIYPSNRLEDLASLLCEVIKHRPSTPFDATTILVPNPGMQHWLSLQICEHMQIAMNLYCPMPTRYVWDVCRSILGADTVPEQSPYKREVLVWRIYDLVTQASFEQQTIYSDVAKYWSQAKSEEEKTYRQFSFAQQLADVLEQYLVFRPTWLLEWEANKTQIFDLAHHNKAQTWQMWFWQQLTKTQPMHPVRLQTLALEKLSKTKVDLPSDIYIFAINSISPFYLSFFDALGQHTNVHFFQLNPCVNYWGDAQSDIAMAKIQRMQAYNNTLLDDALHPLLRNLGQQGRDLINLTNDLSYQEIAAFSAPENMRSATNESANSLLETIQHDILRGDSEQQTLASDTSILVHACHSPVRELQVLKDSLLAMLHSDASIQAKDIVVMCPSIETYSPFIHAIFTQGDDERQNIPVSVSDRKPLESEPLIVAFQQLLKCRHNRFDASSLIDFVSSPAVAARFKLSALDIELCTLWTRQACISWGIDVEHQSHILGEKLLDEKHTWKWGIARLLSGLISAVNDTVVQGVATLSHIEGNNIDALGRYLQCLEQVEASMHLLEVPQTLFTWSQIFTEMLAQFFIPQASDKLALSLLQKAIAGLVHQQNLSSFADKVDISIVSSALENTLTIPETRSQFYSGNVTFCSMLPMRSIPFKVVAILGLNQSDFPRQDTPYEINLIQAAKPQAGDRSRRGDDRYLFLESLLSARQHLHLSYQYRKVSDNSPRQPSLVLQLLIDHCTAHFGENCLNVVEHPLHPFSEQAFIAKPGYLGSYNHAWWQQYKVLSSEQNTAKLNDNNEHIDKPKYQPETQPTNTLFHMSSLVSFLKNSLAYYANTVLSLYLEKPEPRDYSPEYVLSKFIEYKFKDDVLHTLRQPACTEQLLEEMSEYWQLKGDLPYLVGIDETLQSFIQDTNALNQQLPSAQQTINLQGRYAFSEYEFNYDITYQEFCGIRNIKLHRGKPKFNNIIAVWVQYLFLLMHLEQQNESYQALSAGIYFIDDAKDTSNESPKVMLAEFGLKDEVTPTHALNLLLNCFIAGQNTPILLDLDLAIEVLKHESVSDALEDTNLKFKWLEAADEKNNDFASRNGLPNPYFDALFGSMPAFSAASLQVFFDCFGAIQDIAIKGVSESDVEGEV